MTGITRARRGQETTGGQGGLEGRKCERNLIYVCMYECRGKKQKMWMNQVMNMLANY